VGCLVPVAAAPAHADVPSVGVCTANAGLKLGDTGAGVICLQFAMGMMHLTTNPITGTYDKGTEDAVRWYQATHPPLLADGVAGAETLTALGIFSGKTTTGAGVTQTRCTADATIKPADTGPSVSCLQSTLYELGLYKGNISGVEDLATVAALQAYQRDTPPLQVDGWGGPRTLAAMGIWSGSAGGVSATSTSVVVGAAAPIVAPPGPWPSPLQDYPSWNLTPDGIPYYGNHRICSLADANMIAYQFAKDGADVATQQWAVYIASREGGCNYATVNVNPATEDDSHCSFQLNVLSGTFAPTGELGRRGWTPESVTASMQACADAASDLWVYCGRGPWTPPYSCQAPWKDTSLTGTVIGDLSGGDD
jgi:peptidoglycan hydrolase-like protein with peptidoglycan-binding domain